MLLDLQMSNALTRKNQPISMVDHVEEQNLDRRRFVRKLLTLGAAAGVAGILASELPVKPAVQKVYAPSGSAILADGQNTGSSGTVLESDWANVSGLGTLNIINHGTAGAGAFPTAIYGEVSDVDGTPVFGNSTATSGFGTGVYGFSPSSLGQGVLGESTDTSVSGVASGVYGGSTSPDGQGVWGHAVNDTPSLFGVFGDTPSTTGSVGVGGFAYATSGANAGVFGASNAPLGAGTQGNAYAGGGIGVLGRSMSAGANAMVAWAASGQTVNLQEWWNSSGIPLSAVQPNGAMFAPQVGQSTPNYAFAAPGNPASFSNGAGGGLLADGLAIPFTPKLSGNVLVFAAVDFFNPNSNQSTFGQIWYGTGTAPSFGATLPGSGVAVSPGRGNPHGSGSLFAVLPGLTVNTPYWFDLAHGVEVGGVSGSHNNISYIIVEI